MRPADPSATQAPPFPAGPDPGGPPLSRLRIAPAPFLGIVCAFWAYATLSAVLYAYGLDRNFAEDVGRSLFASWEVRVIQYLVLLPPLLGCYWWSLRIGWQPLGPRIVAQLALAFGFALLARPAFVGAMFLLGHMDVPDPGEKPGVIDWIGPALPALLASLTDFLVRYGFGLALVTGFAIYKRYRDSEIRRAELERQWGTARLAALRMQLSPHTLFNLLHTIRGQIAWDPPAAQAMVIQLADLLRRLLNAGERDFSRLADELRFVQLYLELQRRRFPDRLAIDLPEPGPLAEAWVPSLVLQPLVENAVVHGLAGHDGPVHVAVAAESDGDDLLLRVSNTLGVAARASPEGIGLRNVRERLGVQFGDRADLGAGPRNDGHWVATIRMPLLRDAVTAAGNLP